MMASLASVYRWSGQVGIVFALVFSLVFFTLVAVLNLISSSDVPPDSIRHDRPVLRTSPLGTFKIAIFSDLHFGEEEDSWGIDQDINTTRVMRSVLQKEQPDFVVLNGDLITGENTFRENSTDYVHQIVTPMVESGIPWASAYGNHDSQFNLSRDALLHEEAKYRLSLTHESHGSLRGVTNFWLAIKGKDFAPLATLWFLDSRGGFAYQSKPDEPDYIDDWVAPEAAEWFREASKKNERLYGLALPSLVFTHIPPHVYRQTQSDGIDPKYFPGLHKDDPLDYQGHGSDDDALVQALRDTTNVHSIYTGHDHGDSWCTTWPEFDGPGSRPFLCFAKHTGYGGYGSWNRGARMVELDFSSGELDVTTWVRMESGDVVTKVGLNETYGLDKYPQETGEES